MQACSAEMPPGGAGHEREGVCGGRGVARLRAANRELVLLCLGGEGPMSRAGLARRLGLSRSTIGTIARELLREGRVREDGTIAAGGGVGRRATLLHRRDNADAARLARHELIELRRLVERLHHTLSVTERRQAWRVSDADGASAPGTLRGRTRGEHAARLVLLPAELRVRLLEDLAVLDAHLTAAADPYQARRQSTIHHAPSAPRRPAATRGGRAQAAGGSAG